MRYYMVYKCPKCEREHRQTIDLPSVGKGEVTVKGYKCGKCKESMCITTVGKEPVHVAVT